MASTIEDVVVEMAGRLPFAAVERYIEQLEVDEEREAALWMLAWSVRHTRRVRIGVFD